MKRVEVPTILVAVALFTVAVMAEAQQQAKAAKLGWLASGSPSTFGHGRELFRREIRARGYTEGKNITFEVRYGEGNQDRLAAMADELVRLGVDVLLTPNTEGVLALKNATRTIPIVFYNVSDPVEAGLVDSLARPGGNITGFTSIAPVLAGKRLELLKDTIPKLARVAVLWNTQSPSGQQQWKESQLPARELGLQLHSMEVSSAAKLESAFKEAIKARSAALAVASSTFAVQSQKQIADIAATFHLPAIYPREDFVASGGLMSYGPDRNENYRRAAYFVDRILKGAKPADLPVEQPTKFDLVINFKTAKALGLTIPPIVLMRVTKVVK